PAALLLKGRSLVALGRPEDAERALLEGRDVAEQLGFAPMIWQIDMALSGIASDAGDAANAAVLLERARAIVTHLHAPIDDAARRGSFLRVPEVQAVRADGTRAP